MVVSLMKIQNTSGNGCKSWRENFLVILMKQVSLAPLKAHILTGNGQTQFKTAYMRIPLCILRWRAQT